MNLNLRKIVVGLLVLGVLSVVYFFYRHFSDTPPIDMTVQEPFGGGAMIATAGEPNDRVGTIADVGIVTVKQTRFFHTDENSRIDREFGFEELLHREGDQWEITDPFMKLFLSGVKCYVTADRGQVQLETAFGQPIPNDAMFSGNVVIHIIPPEPNDPAESFIYLDDVAFVAEKSLFSTSGSVRFVSRSAQLDGAGMELLYDEARGRLDLFRIMELGSLRLRSDEVGSLTGQGPGQRPPDTASAEAAPPGAAGGGESLVSKGAVQAGGDPNATTAHVSDDAYYQCIFYENVSITTPSQVVFARDQLAIHHILGSSPGSSKGAAQKTVAGIPLAEPNESESPPYPAPEALDTTTSKHLAFDAIPESFFDIVVTCDGGFVVTPMAPGGRMADPVEDGVATVVSEGLESQAVPPVVDPNRQMAIAQRIDYNVVTSDTALAGPVQMFFNLDPNHVAARDAAGPPMPAMITAQSVVRFVKAERQILLEGDCIATLYRTEPNLRSEYTLTAPRFTLNLADDANAPANGRPVALKWITADGGPVVFHSTRRDTEKVLGWVELQGTRLDYGVDRKEFTAMGPGKVTIHSAETADSVTDPNEVSLGQPCYALLRNFDTLTFSPATNLVVAEAESQQILLDYFPLVEGQYGRRTQAVVGRLEVALAQTAENQMELVSLTASQGITYEDEVNRFVGAVLRYDHGRSEVAIHGSAVLPCYFNGVLVDEIEMNLKTGTSKTRTPGPSMLQVNR